MRTALLVTALILAISSLASGQDTLLINYQGRLTDDAGSPITGTPSMTFTIYNSQGIAQWSEIHPTVDVNEGLFSVTLGSEEALPDDVFTGEDRFLGIIVGTDPELSPRTLFTSVPSAAFAKRIAGDLTTLPGVILLSSPDGDSAVTISSQLLPTGKVTSIKMIEPADDGSPIMEMKADAGTNTFTYRIIEPADDDKPVFNFLADGDDATVLMQVADPTLRPAAEFISDGIANTIDFRLVHPPELTAVEIHSDGILGQTSMKMVHPPEAPGAILTSDAISSKVTFKLVHPPELPIISLTGGADDGASIYMFNPQPEPPGTNPILTLNTGGDNSASIYMFNPQPEPPAVLFDLSSTPTTGASMGFFDDAGQVMGVEPTPFNSGFTIKLFNPQPEPPAALAEMTSMYNSDSPRGMVAVYEPDAYLKSELTPGNLKLQFSTGGMDGPALVLKADETTAKIGIGTDAPGFSLEMKSFGTGDGMRVNSSDGSQLFRIRENSDGSCEAQISDLTGATKAMIRANGATYFSGGNVGINITSPSEALHVVGNIYATGTITELSDAAAKTNVETIGGALDIVDKLRGVRYNLNSEVASELNAAEDRQVGMIAQEVEQVLPEVVNQPIEGYKSIDYSRMTAVLVEAIKELKQENEELKKRLEAVENR